MPTQAEIDTAAAKAKQGGGQAAKDTAAAKAKQNNNNQAAKDTARAKSRQNGGDGGTSADFTAREAAAGLYLAGNDTISAGRGGSGSSFADREAANGLTNTTSGRVASRATNPDFPPVGTPLGNDEFTATNNVGGGGGGGSQDFFEIIKTDDNKFKVAFGVVNDTVEPPEVIGGSNETEFTTSGNVTYVYIKLTLDVGDQSVTTAQITTTNFAETTTLARIQIGWLKLDGSGDIETIRNTLTRNPTLLSCSSSHYYIT